MHLYRQSCDLFVTASDERLSKLEVFLIHSVSSQINEQSCQIFRGTTYQNGGKCTKWPQNIPNGHNIYQMAIAFTNWTQNRPNGHTLYQHLPLQDPPKYTQFGIYSLKINHLATLSCLVDRQIHLLISIVFCDHALVDRCVPCVLSTHCMYICTYIHV
jgi:hypothetical protein